MRLLRHIAILGLTVVAVVGLAVIAPNASALNNEQQPQLQCAEGFELEGSTCLQTSDPLLVTSCPDGFVLEADGCESVAPSVPLPDACPEGVLGVPGSCYTIAEREAIDGATATCAEGDLLVEDVCEQRITYSELGQRFPMTECPLFAPALAQIIDGVCVNITTYPPTVPEAPCPGDTIRAATGECRLSVDTATNQVGCSDPNAVLQDDNCIVLAESVTVEECPTGSTASGSQCVTSEAATFGANVAPAELYPGPFTAMPSGPAPGLLDAPAGTMQEPALATSDPVVVATVTTTQLAHTGSDSSLALFAMSSLAVGFSFLASSRRRQRDWN